MKACRLLVLKLPVFLLIGSLNAETAVDFHYSAHLDVGGYGFNQSPHAAALAELFLPLYQRPTQILYADVRAIDKSGPSIEGNFGLGYRWLEDSKQRMYGLYSFYDIKRSNSRHCFNQLMLGGEVWLSSWFIGLNGYLPVGKSKFFDEGMAEVKLQPSGNYQNILYRFGQEAASPGFDLEVGYEFIRGLTLYAGGYYYKRASFPTIAGPLGRFRYIFEPPRKNAFLKALDSITFETQVQYDKPRGTTWYGGVRLTWNLGRSNSSSLSRTARHMIEPPLRDIDIVSHSSPDPFQPLNDSSGNRINIATVRSKGEFESAIQDSNAHVIAVQGQIEDLTGASLLANQTVTGNSYVFSVKNHSFNLSLSPSGSLVSSSAENLLRVHSNNTLRDLTLTMIDPLNTATGNRAIYNDDNVDAMGNILIQNIQTNGVVYINRNGSAKQVNVTLQDNRINTGSWDPVGLPAGVEIKTSNGGSASLVAKNNEIVILNPTFSIQVVGLRLASGPNASIDVGSFQSNTIRASDAGLVNQLLGGAINYRGAFAGNTIIGGATGRPTENGFLSFAFGGSTPSSMTMASLTNNTLIGSSAGIEFTKF